MPHSPDVAVTENSAPESLAARMRIVLVCPQHPGNIGAAARAMKNMGLRELVLVSPRNYPHAQATAMAADAVDLLDETRVCATLEQAVGDCSRVVATTARSRYLSQPTYTPRQWVERQRTQPATGSVALLFGRERTGLTNAELDFSQELISIPVNPDYPSLNLAQAVQVLSYEIRLGALAPDLAEAVAPADPQSAPVPQEEMERYYEHLERTLVATRFLNPDNPRLLMRRLRLLYGRLNPNANEMNIMRGILTAVEDSLRRR